MHQTVNLRTGSGSAVCGDEETERLLEERAAAARRAMTVPHQVAPGQRVRLPNGATLKEGAEVTAAMLEGFVDAQRCPVPGWRVLEQLVQIGDVLEHENARAMLEAGSR